ncbi:MAG: SAM-dependent methyltransferase [Pirellulaceae bacterium]
MSANQFIFVVCQRGAEAVLKKELKPRHPELRLAFSRPGFVTFKVVGELPESFVLRSTFARTYGWSLGKVKGETTTELIEEVTSLVPAQPFDHIHVWQRDEGVPGERGFEPFGTELAKATSEEVQAKLIPCLGEQQSNRSIPVNQTAHADQRVLDIVLVEPNEWWIGYHVTNTLPSRWVGGVPPIEPYDDLPSRAYYKLAEAILWSQIPIRKNDLCIELGSSPGGATLRLLELGAQVFAVDPAEMDEEVLESQGVMHLRMRSKDVPKKDVQGARWLVADLNVAPNYTLDSVEEFVQNQHLHLRGLILTLKLADWSLAADLGAARARVKQWGFSVVKTRHLAFNRQEVCLVAVAIAWMFALERNGYEGPQTKNVIQSSRKRCRRSNYTKNQNLQLHLRTSNARRGELAVTLIAHR